MKRRPQNLIALLLGAVTLIAAVPQGARAQDAVAAAAPAPEQKQEEEKPGEVEGTVVSIRGNILHIRPTLRPRLARVSFSDQTEIVGSRRVTRDFLKPGMRVICGGTYDAQAKTLHPFWLETAVTPIGYLKDKRVGMEISPDGGFAMAGGTLKSAEPLVFTDDAGTEFTLPTDRLRRVNESYKVDRNGLLIGVRLMALGPIAPDGVMKATTIVPDRNFAAAGAMFGEILSVQGDTITMRPRYTTENLPVTITPDCTIQRETRHDPDTVRVGDEVTFWGQWHRPRAVPGTSPAAAPSGPRSLAALALLLGDGRYPSSTEGDDPPVFVTGKVTSLDPEVNLTLASSGEKVRILVPAQMPVARLLPLTRRDLKPGSQAMLVLSRDDRGGFRVSHIILDASPWVGYGG